MIVKSYIKEFETLGFGMFVHFGIYSTYEQGEWYRHFCKMTQEEYETAMNRFRVRPDWARELAKTAKAAGCKYITLTTRHHDGFSLYDTCGLNTYDAPHTPTRRDLVRDFVDACREEGLIPFFYHTLLDWHHPDYDTNFPSYLKYLRDSVELLCKNYGKIGGIWFDGMWNKFDADWEEDALYGLIRSYQPECMIINNTGIGHRGQLGHIELDSVTFECGRPKPINMEDSPKYIASEMCQTLNDHWGYAAYDLNYKPFATLLYELCISRRYHANYLLNVGPMPDGSLRLIDQGVFELFGRFMDRNREAIYRVHPYAATVDTEDDFILQSDDDPSVLYYFACHMGNDADQTRSFGLNGRITSAVWLDTGAVCDLKAEIGKLTLCTPPIGYGNQPTVRIAKLTSEGM